MYSETLCEQIFVHSIFSVRTTLGERRGPEPLRVYCRGREYKLEKVGWNDPIFIGGKPGPS